MTRRDFFKSFKINKKLDVREHSQPVRPPYSKEDETFSLCATCPGNCVTACQTKVISLLDDKSPYMNYESGGCVFCGDCAKACDKQVLSLSRPAVIHGLAELNIDSCAAWKQIACDSCMTVCEPLAIFFYSLFNPKIDTNSCTACGFCVRACHDKALTVITFGEKK